MPLVANLRMTVCKGIGKHSSTQSPAINFDRLAFSLRLYMGYVAKLTGCKTSIRKICGIHGGGHFWPTMA